MYPVLFRIGTFTIDSYGVMMALGFLVADFLITREFRRRKMPVQAAGNVLLAGIIGGIVGAKIFYALERPDIFIKNPLGTLFSGSGLTWYGGFIVAWLLIFWVFKRSKIPVFLGADALVPALALGYGFGRMGCFLAGDGCYGISCCVGASVPGCQTLLPSPLCMAFPHGVAPTSVPVLNTPVWEATAALLTFIYLMWRRKSHRTPGGLFAEWFIIHGILRFTVEFVRRNPRHVFGIHMGLTQAQFISILMVLAGILFFVFWSKKDPENDGLMPEEFRENRSP
ncbi:MAG: prolipoprotein diacylglyceryl transferase [Deltaproteobacteria bacterium]|nr:prolipoprotein diacylglyceryl transferase [Deltaproteobacteria bacterium]